MGWHNYLVIEEKKMLVNLGNKVHSEDFLEDLERYDKFKNMIIVFDEEYYLNEEIEGKRIRDLTMKGVRSFSSIYYIFEKLAWVQSSMAALDLAWKHVKKGKEVFITETEAKTYDSKEWVKVE